MKKVKEQASLIYLRIGIIGELFGFLLSHKLWWAVPLVLFTILLTLLFIFAQHSGVAPFIYPLF